MFGEDPYGERPQEPRAECSETAPRDCLERDGCDGGNSQVLGGMHADMFKEGNAPPTGGESWDFLEVRSEAGREPD